MRVRSIWPVVMALALAVVAGGCALLQPPDPGFGAATTTYATGHATLTIGKQEIVLDQIAPGPHLIDGIGPEIYWFNDAGWGVRLMGGEAGLLMPTMVTIDRVSSAYWSAGLNGNECQAKLDEADANGLRGTATCTGLRWTDMLRNGFGGGYVEGQPAFDATIEFEAAPTLPGA